MTMDKRTIVSSKRARNKRKKAQRTSAKALSAELALDGDSSRERLPQCDSGADTPTDSSSGDEAATASNVRAAAPVEAAAVLSNRRFDEDADTDGEEEYYDEDDELVFVCQAMIPDFCTEFVMPARAAERSMTSKVTAWEDMRAFTVRIPAYRETREGYTTYSVRVTMAGDSQRQFQVERRFSEFVAFANSLDEYFSSSQYQQLREKLQATSEDAAKQLEEDTGNQRSPFQWELPPKTWFRVTQTTALEERRNKLESSLHGLLSHDPNVVCHVPIVRDFLMLDIFGAQVVEEKRQRV